MIIIGRSLEFLVIDGLCAYLRRKFACWNFEQSLPIAKNTYCFRDINVVVPFARLYNKCNKIRQQTDGVMGGTPLRDRRGGRLP